MREHVDGMYLARCLQQDSRSTPLQLSDSGERKRQSRGFDASYDLIAFLLLLRIALPLFLIKLRGRTSSACPINQSLFIGKFVVHFL